MLIEVSNTLTVENPTPGNGAVVQEKPHHTKPGICEEISHEPVAR